LVELPAELVIPVPKKGYHDKLITYANVRDTVMSSRENIELFRIITVEFEVEACFWIHQKI
jgi:hypothetical protein